LNYNREKAKFFSLSFISEKPNKYKVKFHIFFIYTLLILFLFIQCASQQVGSTAKVILISTDRKTFIEISDDQMKSYFSGNLNQGENEITLPRGKDYKVNVNKGEKSYRIGGKDQLIPMGVQYMFYDLLLYILPFIYDWYNGAFWDLSPNNITVQTGQQEFNPTLHAGYRQQQAIQQQSLLGGGLLPIPNQSMIEKENRQKPKIHLKNVRVYVSPVRQSGKVDKGDIKQLTRVVANSFCDSGAGNWTCVSREFSNILEEYKFQQMGLVEEAVKLGKGKGANFVLLVHIDKLSSGSYTISTEFINIESTEKIPISYDVKESDIDSLYSSIKTTLAKEITSKLREITE